MRTAQEVSVALVPLPLVGRGQGWGSHNFPVMRDMEPSREDRATPTPLSLRLSRPPHKGEGVCV